MRLGGDLDAAQKTGQPVLGSSVERLLGGRGGLGETDQREIAGVKQIADRIAVRLNEAGFAGVVFGVGESALGALGNDLADGARSVLQRHQVRGHWPQPLPMLRGVVHPHQPRQRQQAARRMR